MKLTGKPKYSRGKTCPSTTLSTTNRTWIDPGSNPGLRGERPAISSVYLLSVFTVGTYFVVMFIFVYLAGVILLLDIMQIFLL
jgi:hypothetical protein